MSTQQDIYAAGFETHRPMLNKDNYVPWSSRLLRYAKSDPDSDIYVNETFHEQADDELTEKELKQVEANDVTPPDGARTKCVSEGVTSSYFEHKAQENEH
ncbi:hypothetical protein Tco_1567561 [Tanacetum coccineum]